MNEALFHARTAESNIEEGLLLINKAGKDLSASSLMKAKSKIADALFHIQQSKQHITHNATRTQKI